MPSWDGSASRRCERVSASVRPDNVPSLRILERRGFVRTGTQIDDEDGLELVLSRAL